MPTTTVSSDSVTQSCRKQTGCRQATRGPCSQHHAPTVPTCQAASQQCCKHTGDLSWTHDLSCQMDSRAQHTCLLTEPQPFTHTGAADCKQTLHCDTWTSSLVACPAHTTHRDCNAQHCIRKGTVAMPSHRLSQVGPLGSGRLRAIPQNTSHTSLRPNRPSGRDAVSQAQRLAVLSTKGITWCWIS
jgi:hypothetical protein